MVLHLRFVEKRVSLPATHLQTLLDVYGMLAGCNIPGAIRCDKLKVCKGSGFRVWGFRIRGFQQSWVFGARHLALIRPGNTATPP
jgi:hypothetical protein